VYVCVWVGCKGKKRNTHGRCWRGRRIVQRASAAGAAAGAQSWLGVRVRGVKLLYMDRAGLVLMVLMLVWSGIRITIVIDERFLVRGCGFGVLRGWGK